MNMDGSSHCHVTSKASPRHAIDQSRAVNGKSTAINTLLSSSEPITQHGQHEHAERSSTAAARWRPDAPAYSSIASANVHYSSTIARLDRQ